MSPTITALGIDRMNFDERLQLVQDLWDSIAAEAANTPLTSAQQEELARQASRQMKELLDEAIKNGTAQPEPGTDGGASL